MIENIHYLDLSKEDTANLNKSCSLYHSNSGITFKVFKFNQSVLVIEVRQEKNVKEKYLTPKELADRTKDLFSHFYPEHNIKVGTKPYTGNV